MCVCIYVCMHVCMCIIWGYVKIRDEGEVYVYASTHVRMYVADVEIYNEGEGVRVCVCVCIYVCMFCILLM